MKTAILIKTLSLSLLLVSCKPSLVLDGQYSSIERLARDVVELGIPGIAVCYGASVSYRCYQDGYVDFESSLATVETSRFRIASITKTFTAALIYKLADRGLIDVEGNFTDYVNSESVNRIPYINQVRVIDLLEHTSGIYNFTNSDDFEKNLFGSSRSGNLNVLPDELLVYATQMNNKPSFLPGKGHEYSNTGYILLGLLIEEVTGLSYAQALDTYVFAPCGMTDTGLEGSSSYSPDLHSYTYADTWDRIVQKQFGIGNGILDGRKQLNSNSLFNVSSGRQGFNGWAWSAGAINSTATDLARFLQCYLDGNYQATSNLDEVSQYSTYGWRGLSTGIDALMMFDVKERNIYVVLINVTNSVVDANDIYQKLRQLVIK